MNTLNNAIIAALNKYKVEKNLDLDRYDRDLKTAFILDDPQDKKEVINQILPYLDLQQGEFWTEVEYQRSQDVAQQRRLIQTQAMVKSYLMDKNTNKASEIITEYLLEYNHVHTIINDKEGEMWIYHDGVYVKHGRTYLKEQIRKILGERYAKYVYNKTLDRVEVDTLISADEFFKEEPAHYINVQNGTYNLLTGKLEPHTPERKFFQKHPVEYKTTASCPKVQQFIRSVVETDDDVKVIQELFGYCLYREYTIEKSVMLLGNGRNGKGKVLGLLRRFLGPENCSSVSLQTLESGEFSQINLHNKNANVCGDLDRKALKGTGTFKQLTGRDLISANRKGQSFLTFVNYAKLVFACNQLPATPDLSEGFLDRWVILDFPYKFLVSGESPEGHDPDKVFTADPNIIEGITTQEELNGLFLWALEGLQRLLRQRDFTNSTTGEEVKRRWMRETSSLHAFIYDCVVSDSTGMVPKNDFEKAYHKYCGEHKVLPLQDRKFLGALAETVGGSSLRKKINGENHTVYAGCRLKDDAVFRVGDEVLRLLRQLGEASWEEIHGNVGCDFEVVENLKKNGIIYFTPGKKYSIVYK